MTHTPTRRGFFRLVAGAAALAAVRPTLSEAESIPTLWSDMVHDDAEALAALFDGKPVHIVKPELAGKIGWQGHVLRLDGLTCRSSAPLDFTGFPGRTAIYGGSFEIDGHHKYLTCMRGGEHVLANISVSGSADTMIFSVTEDLPRLTSYTMAYGGMLTANPHIISTPSSPQFQSEVVRLLGKGGTA